MLRSLLRPRNVKITMSSSKNEIGAGMGGGLSISVALMFYYYNMIKDPADPFGGEVGNMLFSSLMATILFFVGVTFIAITDYSKSTLLLLSGLIVVIAAVVHFIYACIHVVYLHVRFKEVWVTHEWADGIFHFFNLANFLGLIIIVVIVGIGIIGGLLYYCCIACDYSCRLNRLSKSTDNMKKREGGGNKFVELEEETPPPV